MNSKILKRIKKMDREALENCLLGLEQEKNCLQYLLNQIPAGILLLDKEKQVLWSNETTQNILGAKIAKDRKVPLLSLIHDSTFKNWLEKELDKGNGVFGEEKEILDPHHRFLIVSVRPLANEDLAAAACLVVLVDVTSIRLKEKEEGQLHRVLSLVKLAKGIAHELGNPLNSITIHLKLLSKLGPSVDGKEKKKFQDTIKVLDEETRRLDRIIKNFLKATRQKPPEFKLNQINDVLENALRFFEPEFKDFKIKIKADFSGSLPEFLFDRDKLYQSFLNLLKNAIEAMPEGGELWVKTAFREKVCSIAFQDTGAGIPEQDLPYIFEEYYSTKEEGSGLGLAIVYNIVREHGGRIEVKSSPEKGTLFVIYLPIRLEKLQIPMETQHG